MSASQHQTTCVYTIINHDTVEQSFANGGVGEFTEGRPWASALRHLNGLDPSETYPLLLADAATTAGVEWVAKVESIELLPEGGTRVEFSSLVELAEVIQLHSLRKTSDGQPLSDYYIRPYMPCSIAGEDEELVLGALAQAGAGADPYGVIETKTVDDYVAALREIEPKVTKAQRAMLVGHANARRHALSMLALATLGGYDKFQSANMQYGALGRKFADFFGVRGLANQTQAMAYLDVESKDDHGHFLWLLREPLVEALRQIGWATKPSLTSLLAAAAAQEINSDPQCSSVSETVRHALVEARIGQGGYRSRLMALWGGRCALTGCTLPEVLIASHSKAWADSSNQERLDEYNGLLLAAHVDKLFDAGLISFAADGRMLRGSSVDADVLHTLGIPAKARLRFVAPRHLPYLAAHRARYGFRT